MKNTILLLAILTSLLATVFNNKTYAFVTATPKHIYYDKSTDTLYSFHVKYPPTFPGGYDEFTKFLNNNIHFPKTSRQLTGKLYAEVIIERNGTLSPIKLLRDTDNAAGKELLRVLSLSPKWAPGESEYKKKKYIDRTVLILPINFNSGKLIVTDLSKQTTQDSINNHQIFLWPDSLPVFPGGEEGFGLFLRNNIRYPKIAKENNVKGRVFLQFVIEDDGTLTHMQILRDPGSGLGDETMRVLNLSPNWVPAKKKGQPIRSQYTVPVNFSLAN